MKNPFDYTKIVPKSVIEAFIFFLAVLYGAVHKMVKQNEKGIKITLKTMGSEIISSIFIACLVYAVFDQFFHFNKLFTLMMCSLASSKSAKFDTKIEDFFDWVYDTAKKGIEEKFNIKKR